MTTIRSTSTPMSLPQESTGLAEAGWAVAAGEARRIVIGPGPRSLKVSSGRVWLTITGDATGCGEDHWLQAGEAAWLDAGAEVVLEGWGAARFDLLVPPCPGRASVPWRARLVLGLQRWLAAAEVSRPRSARGGYLTA